MVQGFRLPKGGRGMYRIVSVQAVQATMLLATLVSMPAAAETLSFNLFATSTYAGTRSQTLNFQPFDSNLGTLTGVTMDVATSQITLAHYTSISGGNAGDMASATSHATYRFSFAGHEIGGSREHGFACQVSFSGAGCSIGWAVTPGLAGDDPIVLGLGDDLSGFLTAPVAATVAIPDYWMEKYDFFASGSSARDTSQSSVSWYGSATLSYQYDAPPPPSVAAPEPASMALLCPALGFGALLRRRAGGRSPA